MEETEIEMIRKSNQNDINRIAEIWLDTNIKVHNFIPKDYWKNYSEKIKEMFLNAEIYVYQDEKNEIQGFIGMNHSYIEGIFVWKEERSKGIGKQLLDFVKSIKPELTLNVYQKNERAIKFYERENFRIEKEELDENTGEEEYLMIWERNDMKEKSERKMYKSRI